ncbi:MAG TPA: hypothetical protein ENK18_26450 [Deltaproteobacteria bacterium]|nr:hypothetical protein [Deltaproteobacteria bacterium]
MSNISRDTMLRILKDSAEAGAEEVHFKVPNRPLMRMPSGALVPTRMQALSPADVKAAVFALCALGHLELPIAKISDHEFSFGINQLGRFRAFIYRQRGSLGAVVRRVNTRVPSLEDLGLDAAIETYVGQPGLLLVAGTHRNGALHSLVNGYNARERSNVVILESPLTYLHRDAMSAISHREVGTDVPSFATGISQAIRLGADLLAVGDVEDAATAEQILCASEREMPVIAALAAPCAAEATWWFSRLFYGQHRDDILYRLEQQLLATVSVSIDRTEVVPAEEEQLEAL